MIYWKHHRQKKEGSPFTIIDWLRLWHECEITSRVFLLDVMLIRTLTLMQFKQTIIEFSLLT